MPREFFIGLFLLVVYRLPQYKRPGFWPGRLACKLYTAWRFVSASICRILSLNVCSVSSFSSVSGIR